MEKFKANKKYLIIGLFLPFLGIAFSNIVFDEVNRRSMKKGSALSGIIVTLILSLLLMLFVGLSIGK